MADASVVAEGGERVLPDGTIVARNYRVGKSLGSGGNGTVYLGRNLTLDQRVVIKVLREGVRGAGAEEARVLAGLDLMLCVWIKLRKGCVLHAFELLRVTRLRRIVDHT